MAKNTLGQWLKGKCQEEHLSLRQAGERAGLNHTTMHKIVKGEHASAETVVKLARAFGGGGRNQRIALEDELLTLAGYRTSQEHISQPLAKLLDIARDFSDSQMKVLNDFAVYIKEK